MSKNSNGLSAKHLIWIRFDPAFSRAARTAQYGVEKFGEQNLNDKNALVSRAIQCESLKLELLSNIVNIINV